MNECWTRSADPGPAGPRPAPPEREHYGLAVACAKRFYGRGVPAEELTAEAEAALLWAAARFDPARGARFSTYAIPFVLGALRELCRKSAPMRIPRGELRILCAARCEREELRQQTGREPTMAELGQRLRVPPEKLAAMLAAQQRMSAITADRAQAALALEEDGGFENRVLLRDAVRRLGRPYAQVLWLRYFAGLSQAEIAARFGVHPSRVSRWEAGGKERLRQSLAL